MRPVLAALIAVAASAALAEEPPPNPHLAASTWPIYHQDNYAQASTVARGPEAGDRIDVQFVATPDGDVSPWTVLTAPYADGSQAAWGTTRKGVFKAVFKGAAFDMSGWLPLPRRPLDFDWGILALANGDILTTNKKANAFLVIGDARPGKPGSPIIVKKRIVLPDSAPLSTHFTMSYDGAVIFLTDNKQIGALRLDGGEPVLFDLAPYARDVSVHNSFPIDEEGRIFLTTQAETLRIDWNGKAFSLGWRAPYDFRGPGCERRAVSGRAQKIRDAVGVARGARCTGTGTTPTLIGEPDDGLVLVVDGHAPANHAVVFWRDEIPADWQKLDGLDRRVAGRVALPRSTPLGEGFTAENSPPAAGLSGAVAQWAGFKPDCSAPRGVQKTSWDPAVRRLKIDWVAPDAAVNGVLTLSTGSRLLYGSGRVGCTYTYIGLDWATGRQAFSVPMGDDARFLDQGNQSTLAGDRSILFGSARGLVRIRPY